MVERHGRCRGKPRVGRGCSPGHSTRGSHQSLDNRRRESRTGESSIEPTSLAMRHRLERRTNDANEGPKKEEAPAGECQRDPGESVLGARPELGRQGVVRCRQRRGRACSYSATGSDRAGDTPRQQRRRRSCSWTQHLEGHGAVASTHGGQDLETNVPRGGGEDCGLEDYAIGVARDSRLIERVARYWPKRMSRRSGAHAKRCPTGNGCERGCEQIMVGA